MGKDREIQGLEIYYPEIYLKANKVIKCYNELLIEIIQRAEKENWKPDYWHAITIAITVDLIRTILNMQADLVKEAGRMLREEYDGDRRTT